MSSFILFSICENYYTLSFKIGYMKTPPTVLLANLAIKTDTHTLVRVCFYITKFRDIFPAAAFLFVNRRIFQCCFDLLYPRFLLCDRCCEGLCLAAALCLCSAGLCFQRVDLLLYGGLFLSFEQAEPLFLLLQRGYPGVELIDGRLQGGDLLPYRRALGVQLCLFTFQRSLFIGVFFPVRLLCRLLFLRDGLLYFGDLGFIPEMCIRDRV